MEKANFIRVALFLGLMALLVPSFGRASERSRMPVIRSFSKESYGGSSQNWSIVQDGNGTVFVANSSGLLEFDGSSWIVHPSPDGNIIRAVAVDSSGTVYTSGYQELGYWQRDSFGVLQYKSLKEEARSLFTPNVEFWNIFIDGERVLFQAFTQILVFEAGSFSSIRFDRFVNSVSLTGGRFFINEMDTGIFEIRDSLKLPFVTGDFFRGKTMRFLLPYDEKRFLLGTASDGLFLVSEGKVEVWETPLNDQFRKVQINRARLLKGGEIVIGTILDGVFALAGDGRPLWHLNSHNGLQNNTVLGLFPDREGNLWVALDRGVDLLITGSSWGVRNFSGEGTGAVYDAAVFEGKLYLGTNQGLYCGELNGFSEEFRIIPGTQGQVWDLEVIGNELVIGHNSGTFTFSRDKLRLISPVSGGFSIRPDPDDPGTWVQCTYSNLVKYKMAEGRLKESSVIYNFNELINFIEFDHWGNLWAGHMHRGIFRLRFTPSRDSVMIIKYYGEESVFGKDHHLRVFKVENRIVFTSGEKLYTYDDLSDDIIPHDRLNFALGEYSAATRIIPVGNNLYWMVLPSRLALWYIEGGASHLIREFPAGVFGNQLIGNYENAALISDGEALVCLEDGFAVVDLQDIRSSFSGSKSLPEIRSVWLNGRDGQPRPFSPKSGGYRIPWALNSFHTRVAFPWYGGGPLSWEWYLEGWSTHWNSNGESPVFAFDRLPAGRYTLKIRAADSWGNRSRELPISLMVRNPWYWSVAARICYLLVAVTALMMFRNRIMERTRKMEQRKREENEKELIKLKNEKLQSDISFKSRELASSTMSLIKKNQFLLDLRELVLSQKNQLGTRYPDKYSRELLRRIDNHLSSDDEWKIFETNFELAHETFMKNLKNRYPALTPGDMRLCAFLRMNLSSKEIAPLMGISVRGVENHRYRLRRKLQLEHDQNLIGSLLEL